MINKRNNKGQFVKGGAIGVPIGTIRIRVRLTRGGSKRKWIKIGHPNDWILNCVYVWEQANGKLPPGYFIHHIDGDKLNDDLLNLEIVDRKKHLELHRPEFQDRAIASFVAARKRIRWSTKKKS